VALAPVGSLTLITDQRRLAADGGALPLTESTKATRLASLIDGEVVTAAVL